MPTRASRLYRFPHLVLNAILLVFVCSTAACSFAAAADAPKSLALTPPMGWNDWAHYQCGFTAQTILDNARALVKTGLAARGYNTVTIDDCWMQKDRDAHGNLQADPQRFPQGMKSVADAVHALGLKFGIYEDAGYETCGGFAGSGEPNGGSKDHFLQDARLFASWGVDYLKLDGCNLYVPKGRTKESVYRKAYAAESAALKKVGRPIVFSESAPAYFQGTPDWYDVLRWVRDYGQLWREGTDVAVFETKKPDDPRFHSVLWNYAYNLPLGRFQKLGNWNDADFIIGGDAGMSVTETRSQMALWAMMSAPLIMSSNLDKLRPQAIAIVGNKAVIAVDQDTLGRMATLIRRSPEMDVLFKPLRDGGYAVAVLNRSAANIQADLHPVDLGFRANAECRLDAQNLWTKTGSSTVSTLQANIAAHDTAIWRIRPTESCGKPTRTGAITMIAPGKHRENIEGYSVCLSASGRVEACAGTPTETWTITAHGALKSAGRCLTAANGDPAMEACAATNTQHWNYTLVGNLVGAKGGCLTAAGSTGKPHGLSIEPCGRNQRNQIWSLPN
ncbi:MAG: ricin-type beta-trefoil lectin domain protein [Acidobacteriaceae bacterium]